MVASPQLRDFLETFHLAQLNCEPVAFGIPEPIRPTRKEINSS